MQKNKEGEGKIIMLTAITRGVSPRLGECELSFLSRETIDINRATQQHRAYEEYLAGLGVRLLSLPAEPEFPDSVFVEDTAVVLKEVAVVTSMGAASRRGEVGSMAQVLSQFRPLKFLSDRARLEGGDCLRVDHMLYVGASCRTNHEGIAQLGEILSPYGYEVRAAPVKACLHFKTGCSFLGRRTLLANRSWVDMGQFDGEFEVIDVPPAEPWAANVLVIDDKILLPDSFPRTRDLLESRGFHVHTIDVSELMKAEAGLTCMSIIFDSSL